MFSPCPRETLLAITANSFYKKKINKTHMTDYEEPGDAADKNLRCPSAPGSTARVFSDLNISAGNTVYSGWSAAVLAGSFCAQALTPRSSARPARRSSAVIQIWACHIPR